MFFIKNMLELRLYVNYSQSYNQLYNIQVYL